MAATGPCHWHMRRVLQSVGLVFVSLAIFVCGLKFTDTSIGKNADPPPHMHAVGGNCPGDMAVRMRKVLQTVEKYGNIYLKKKILFYFHLFQINL